MSEANSATEVDQGLLFGTWPDETSRLIYFDAMPALLAGIPRATDRVLDLGGGNGLMRPWFYEPVTTVDTDPAKQPDVVADITEWAPQDPSAYTRVLLRYVLHYLTDTEVLDLFCNHLPSWWDGPVTVIQFVAPSSEFLAAKLSNSVNESKTFRTEAHLLDLLTLSGRWTLARRVALDYDVTPDFYTHRLGAEDPTGHPERLVALTLENQ